MEETLVLIKPDGLKNANNIIDIFYNNDLEISKYKIMKLDNEIVDEHYSHLLDKPFYPRLKEFMLSDYIIAFVLVGENAVFRVRELVGATNPENAKEGTIRKLYGTDSTMNAVHASDSIENAQIEINRFFNRDKQLKLIK